ncbi:MULTISPECIES: rhodanese-like domain-containing protein [unclassified Microbacterium]|uniref:rhodanese-like domain-containing protein n=1 Tax=unclassified Microbacterium TaxID=2609290 RepID=UPI000DE3EC36|nr:MULTISPECIES: rhodanese-like domain-containing protein [unclassified Microbacterium]NYF29987.1 rhodanese-related sulfurtransferase [Microbacterium sp. JAI119]RBO74044.1 sulfurtransferase [Microbacterium sp. H6]
MIDRTDFYEAKLTYETDSSDVHAAIKAGENLVVIDVRSDEAWAQGRVAGAVHMRYSEIASRAPREIPADTDVVVYCWSPGCNAGAKGALEFARLGYRVREMIGGFEYWVREGYAVEDADGVHHRPVDPLTGIARIRTRA